MGDVSKGDSSVYYPVTTEKITLANTYYAYANFYDYYSNYELTTGLNRKTITTPVKLGNYDEVNSIYKQQDQFLIKQLVITLSKQILVLVLFTLVTSCPLSILRV